MKSSFDTRECCRCQELAIGINDEQIARPVEDNAAAIPRRLRETAPGDLARPVLHDLERMRVDTSAFLPLPPAPYDACHKVATRVSSLSLVRYRNNDYSVPTRHGHQEVLAKGYVDRVEIACRGETIATHVRSYKTADFIYNPLHYLALLEHKSKALDQDRSIGRKDRRERIGSFPPRATWSRSASWLGEAAASEAAFPPTIHRIAGSWRRR